MKFETTIFLDGNNTGIEVPPEVVESLGGGKRASVVVTIGSFIYRSTIATMAGRFLIPLSAARRAEAGVAGGDRVEVDLVLDTAPREVVLPDDFAAALAADPAVKTFYDSLSYSNQNKHVLSITEAKTPETRSKRIAKAVELLRQGKK